MQAFGTGIDPTVRKITRGYEVRGMLERVTSVGDGGVTVNEVQLAYDSYSQLVTDCQAHGGPVDVSTTPKVQYGYADGSANTVRPVSMTYPDGRMLDYDYGSGGGMNDALSRIGSIQQGGIALAAYNYLGLGQVVQTGVPTRPVRAALSVPRCRPVNW